MGTALQVDQELVLGALLHLEVTALQGTVKLQGKWRRVYLSDLSLSLSLSPAPSLLPTRV